METTQKADTTKKAHKSPRSEGQPRVKTWQKIVLVSVVGIILAGLTSYEINNTYVGGLRDRVQSFAYSFNAARVQELSDLTKTNDQTSYSTIKQRLTDLKSVYADTRFVYIMDQQADKVRFLADSEAVGSDGYSPRGEEYDDTTTLLKSEFTGNTAAVEGPVKDEYGIWYSALAPIKDASGKTIAVIGVDVPAIRYLLVSIGVGLSVILATAILAVIVFLYDRARNRRLSAFHFQVELMSIASHELRSPLSGIRWGQEILQQSNLDNNQKTVVNAMYNSTLQLQESIEDILQLASIGTSITKKPSLVQVDVAEIVSSAAQAQQLSAREKENHIVYDPSWKSPLLSMADNTQLRRVFNNIFSNAIKYSSIGSDITISYMLKDGDHLIVVKNLGIGVPHKEMEHIFEGFYRASNAVKEQANGTGMGLYLSRVSIENFGGHLWLDSVENESTTVYVQLPIFTEDALKDTPAKPAIDPKVV